MMLVFSSKSFSQVKVQEQVPQILVLKTMDLKLEYDYYNHTFMTGYEYPAIQQGFYFVSLITNLDGLILFYTELSNLSNAEDGKYTLTMKISSSNSTFKNVHFVALKKGKKINLLSSSSAYAITLAKFKIEYLQEDLNTIKALIKQ